MALVAPTPELTHAPPAGNDAGVECGASADAFIADRQTPAAGAAALATCAASCGASDRDTGKQARPAGGDVLQLKLLTLPSSSPSGRDAVQIAISWL